MTRKADGGLTVLLIVVVILLFLGWLFNASQRECRSNKDCSSESYCGSDFSCHSYPTIQKTVVQYNFVWPSVIIGIAMIIVAVILKWSELNRKPAEKQESEKQYY